MSGIIVGTDGSVHSRRALDWAIREAGIRCVPLTVVTVHEAVADYWGVGAYPGDQAEPVKQARKAAREEIDLALERLSDQPQPPSVTVHAVSGLPAEELLKIASDEDAEMIVVGCRGAGGFKKLLLGSVSTQLTHHAHCPVVVIPPKDRR